MSDIVTQQRKRIYDILELCLISFAYGLYKRSSIAPVGLAVYITSKNYWRENHDIHSLTIYRTIDVITVNTCWAIIEINIICSPYHWYVYNTISAINLLLYSIGSIIENEVMATNLHILLHILSNIGNLIVFNGIDGNGSVCPFTITEYTLCIYMISIAVSAAAIKYGAYSALRQQTNDSKKYTT